MSETLSFCYSHIQHVSLLHVAQQDTTNSMKNYNGIYTKLLLAIDSAYL